MKASGPTVRRSHRASSRPYFCEYLGTNRYLCRLTATGWTQIRWQYNGSTVTAFNDKTNTGIATCSGTPTIKVYVANLHGMVSSTRTIRCSGPPL
jgi:hypothetical protein